MKIINQSFEILDPIDRVSLLKKIELAGRTCYKSEDKITEGSASRFVTNLVKSGHLSVIEHVNITCKFVTNRGISHELVRHRLASYSQESTRYVNYGSDKQGNEITVISPSSSWFPHEEIAVQDWYNSIRLAETTYLSLLSRGIKPESARGVLPHDLKTEVVMTANLREWKHIFEVRCSQNAHPQIRELISPFYEKMKELLPEVY